MLLLHVAALFSSRIEIPQWDRRVATKLFPVVAINIVGLVFNTLCLREVEATFFQVLPSVFSLPRHPAQFWSSSDCKRLSLTLDHCYHPRQISPTPSGPCYSCSRSRHHRIFHRCHSRGQSPRVVNSITKKSSFRRIFLTLNRCPFGLGQGLTLLLRQLDDSTGVLDQCGICPPTCPICTASRRTGEDHGIECGIGLAYECFHCREPGDGNLWFPALRGRVTQHQSDESRHPHVFKRASRPSLLVVINFIFFPQ